MTAAEVLGIISEVSWEMYEIPKSRERMHVMMVSEDRRGRKM